MVKMFARTGVAQNGSALGSLAAVGAMLATITAVILGAILAVFAAATVAVLAVVTSALLAVAGLAMRARRVRARRTADNGVIEARHLGGHHWVAYGWNERR